MRRYLFTFLNIVLLACGTATRGSAQTDVVSVVVHDDTVTVWNTNVYYPCAVNFVITATQYLQTIVILEEDTTPFPATCMCYYQMSADFVGLAPGDYQAIVRRSFKIYEGEGVSRDTTYEVGRVNFTVTSQVGGYQMRGYQSPCQQFAGVPHPSEGSSEAFTIDGAYPNPFNAGTRISFRVPYRQLVRLSVFDLAGRRVAALGEGVHEAGSYTYHWEPGSLPSGLYLVRAEAGGKTAVEKVLYTK